MWQVFLAEMALSAVLIGVLARSLWRYDRHMKQTVSGLDRFRDEMIASTRARVNEVIAEMRTSVVLAPLPIDPVSPTGAETAPTPSPLTDRNSAVELQPLPR